MIIYIKLKYFDQIVNFSIFGDAVRGLAQHWCHAGSCVWASGTANTSPGGHTSRLLDLKSIEKRENLWNSMKFNENQRKSMKIYENLWKSIHMNGLEVQQATRAASRRRVSGSWCPNTWPSMASVLCETPTPLRGRSRRLQKSRNSQFGRNT